MEALPTHYEVFLSFRGADDCIGFIYHLYKRLLDAGVCMSRNDCALLVRKEKGREQLVQAIAISIISQGYANRTWCLRELAAIMDCRGRDDKLILLVLYKLDVVDLGRRRGNFDDELKCSSKEVLKWQEALTSVVRIREWISQSTTDGHEGELVQTVVAKVLSELKRMWIQRLLLFIGLEKKRRERKYHVFLAFRGPNTRYNLADYLYINGIRNRSV